MINLKENEKVVVGFSKINKILLINFIKLNK